MELVKLMDDKKVCELRDVAVKFNKEHYDLIKSVKKLLATDPTLVTEMIPHSYKDSKGETRPTYLLTREGFCILCMGFTGAKALEWKRRFYKAFERLEKDNQVLLSFMKKFLGMRTDDETLLVDILKNSTTELLTSLDSTDNSCTLRNIKKAFERLEKDNHALGAYLNTINHTDMTYCITDLCCKFVDLSPYTANKILMEEGIIEKRASGYYPSLQCLEWAVSATAWNGNNLENYVRYTPKGMQYIYNMLKNRKFDTVESV